MYQSCAENKLSERERKAYRKKKKDNKEVYSYFFCGNECERCIICTYPGAKKKCLFDILFNLLFFLLFKICSYPSLSRIKQTQRLFSFLLFFLSHTFFTFFFSSYFFSPFSLFSSAHTSFTFCLLSTLHSLSLSLSQSLWVFHKLLA